MGGFVEAEFGDNQMPTMESSSFSPCHSIITRRIRNNLGIDHKGT